MAFSMTQLEICGVILIKSDKYIDNRGYFTETYARAPFANGGIDSVFVQDNQSLSVKTGTLRGLHFQREPAVQAKLVRVIQGSIFDVAVDIRPGSSSYGKWCGINLTAEGGEQLFVPRGFAHGFITLEPNTIVTYKVDAPYMREAEGGIHWNDPVLKIDWPMPSDGPVVAERDGQLPLFKG